MALQKTEVSLNLSGKLDTKTDPKLVAENSVLTSENVEYSKTGAIKKVAGLALESQVVVRNSGYSETTLAVQKPEGFVTDFDKMVMYRQPSDKGLLVYSDVEQKWISTNFDSGSFELNFLPQHNTPNYSQKIIDSGDQFGFRSNDICYSSKFNFYVAIGILKTESNGRDLYIFRLDSNKNVVAKLRCTYNANISYAQVFIDDTAANASGCVFNIFYIDATTQELYKGHTDYNLGSFLSAGVVYNRPYTDKFVAKINPYNNQVYVCCFDRVNNHFIATSYQKTGLTTGYGYVNQVDITPTKGFESFIVLAPYDITFTPTRCVLVYACNSVTRNIAALTFSHALVLISNSVQFTAIGEFSPRFMSCCYNQATSEEVQIVFTSVAPTYGYSWLPNKTYYQITDFCIFNGSTLAYSKNSEDKAIMIPFSIRSDLINKVINGVSKFFFTGSVGSSEGSVASSPYLGETTDFLIEIEPEATSNYIFKSSYSPIARYNIDNGFPALYFTPENFLQCKDKLIFNGNYLVTNSLYFSKLNSTTKIGTNFDNSCYGIKLIEFDFSENIVKTSQKIGRLTLISGAIPTVFDGNNYTIQGFLSRPKIQGITITPNINGNFDAGDYSVKIVAEYTGANGEVEQSRPSLAYNFTVAAKSYVYIDYVPQTFTEKHKSSVKVYVTDASGTIYREKNVYNQALGFMKNGAAPYSFSIQIGTITGVSKSSDEVIYTQSGELENDPLPPSKYILSAKDRIFSISADDNNTLFYSKVYLPSDNINFSAFLYKKIEAENAILSDDFTALGLLDEKIIIFKENSIYAFQGDGPTNSGTNDSFTTPAKISVEVGCSEPKSLVSTPIGLMFKSLKGIYLIDRGLNVSYIGQDIESYNSQTVVSSILHQNKNIIIFMINSSYSLVYDYLQAKWGIYLGYNGSDLTVFRNVLRTLKSYAVYSQSTTDYRVNSANNPMKIITPWYKVSGIENFGRIYKALLLGKFKSAHDLIVKTYYDYDETLFETFTINPLNTDAIYQYQINLSRQKCQSIKFEIYDNSTSGSYEGLELTDMSVTIGKKKGLNKISDSKAYQGA